MGLIRAVTAVLLFCLSSVALAEAAVENKTVNQEKPRVRLTTDFGDIVLELYPDKAPVTVKNFLEYVGNYHYDGLIFHRVVKGFVIQTGGYGYDLYPREPGAPIVNESANGLSNTIGSVAMARTADPDSARAQFFINIANNRYLDGTASQPGYTVFGRVVEGLLNARKISLQPVRRSGPHQHLPREPIQILKARIETAQQGGKLNDSP